ncbi:AraC family transcriptional regulator [Marinobacter zhejiangensis]|uniref:Helix-turn-helix domain-containing protein n=1 Tax=Marinobacter zhejiangensis TaxID=488535 RepID=A0A1I4L0F4_9GAMM|nr:helix-turn-helix domain-containing protein [Marinobacter zhejiangensis]SFL84500.1 Helix-turn-helix domain-containing protein [Marinobacter zhejiangensis]
MKYRELQAYLRLQCAKSCEWLAALRYLNGDARLELRIDRSHSARGFISELVTDKGSISCTGSEAGFRLTGYNGPYFVIGLVHEGAIELIGRLDDDPMDSGVFVLSPGEKIDLVVSAGFQSTVLRFPKKVFSRREILTSEVLNGIRDTVLGYLQRSLFFYDHAHAIAETRRLQSCVVGWLKGQHSNTFAQSMVLDRRIGRAIVKMQSEVDWTFDLAELARCAGVSERNLYYLMNSHIGMTPYRFHQRCRLSRVRERLVDCQGEQVNISRFASDEGFTHTGRFAALYREHFGELPKETVQLRRAVLADESEVSAASA